MTNERLYTALDRSGLNVQTIADKTQVDPKTVTRWLSGRVPHPTHRVAVARLVNEDEEYLWPSALRAQTNGRAQSEILGSFAHRANVDVNRWQTMFENASEHIDLLGYTLYFLPQMIPELPEILTTKCEGGTRIRIVVADPECEQVRLRDLEEREPITIVARIHSSLKAFQSLADCPNAELHFQTAPLYNSIFRFDDEMFVTPHLYATPGHFAPLLHLRRLGSTGMFASFASHFDALWSDTQPIGHDRWEEETRAIA